MPRKRSDVHVASRGALPSNHRLAGHLTLGMIATLIISIVGVIVVCLRTAPICTILILICLGVFIAFVATERKRLGYWHRAIESEQRFWTLWVSSVACAFIFAPDSPFSVIFQGRLWLGLIVNALVAAYVNDREVAGHSDVLRRTDQLPRVSSITIADSDSAKKKLAQITAVLEAIESKSSSYRLSINLSSRARNAERLQGEREILSVLGLATNEELNYMISNVGLAWMYHTFQDIDTPPPLVSSNSTPTTSSSLSSSSSLSPAITLTGDGDSTRLTPAIGPISTTHPPPSPGGSTLDPLESAKAAVAATSPPTTKIISHCRTDLMELLCVRRLHHLEVVARACLVDALQVVRLTSHPRSEYWVENVLCSTYGTDLTNLKSILDTKGDANSLHKLLFHDISNPLVRNRILAHINTQGSHVIKMRKEAGLGDLSRPAIQMTVHALSYQVEPVREDLIVDDLPSGDQRLRLVDPSPSHANPTTILPLPVTPDELNSFVTIQGAVHMPPAPIAVSSQAVASILSSSTATTPSSTGTLMSPSPTPTSSLGAPPPTIITDRPSRPSSRAHNEDVKGGRKRSDSNTSGPLKDDNTSDSTMKRSSGSSNNIRINNQSTTTPPTSTPTPIPGSGFSSFASQSPSSSSTSFSSSSQPSDTVSILSNYYASQSQAATTHPRHARASSTGRALRGLTTDHDRNNTSNSNSNSNTSNGIGIGIGSLVNGQMNNNSNPIQGTSMFNPTGTSSLASSRATTSKRGMEALLTGGFSSTSSSSSDSENASGEESDQASDDESSGKDKNSERCRSERAGAHRRRRTSPRSARSSLAHILSQSPSNEYANVMGDMDDDPDLVPHDDDENDGEQGVLNEHSNILPAPLTLPILGMATPTPTQSPHFEPASLLPSHTSTSTASSTSSVGITTTSHLSPSSAHHHPPSSASFSSFSTSSSLGTLSHFATSTSLSINTSSQLVSSPTPPISSSSSSSSTSSSSTTSSSSRSFNANPYAPTASPAIRPTASPLLTAWRGGMPLLPQYSLGSSLLVSPSPLSPHPTSNSVPDPRTISLPPTPHRHPTEGGSTLFPNQEGTHAPLSSSSIPPHHSSLLTSSRANVNPLTATPSPNPSPNPPALPSSTTPLNNLHILNNTNINSINVNLDTLTSSTTPTPSPSAPQSTASSFSSTDMSLLNPTLTSPHTLLPLSSSSSPSTQLYDPSQSISTTTVIGSSLPPSSAINYTVLSSAPSSFSSTTSTSTSSSTPTPIPTSALSSSSSSSSSFSASSSSSSTSTMLSQPYKQISLTSTPQPARPPRPPPHGPKSLRGPHHSINAPITSSYLTTGSGSGSGNRGSFGFGVGNNHSYHSGSSSGGGGGGSSGEWTLGPSHGIPTGNEGGGHGGMGPRSSQQRGKGLHAGPFPITHGPYSSNSFTSSHSSSSGSRASSGSFDLGDSDWDVSEAEEDADEAETVPVAARNPGPLRKILSDVDDTLFSSGGHFPAGVDRTYPKHTLYPGVLCFLKELDLGFDAVGDWLPIHGKGNLAFLSARPHVYKDKSEKKSYRTFQELRDVHGLHAVPTLLPGSLESGFSMFVDDYVPMAKKKFKNFDEFASLYPEYHFIFLGDNGQGDVLAGEMMKKKYGDRVELVLVHEVQPIERTPGYSPAKEKEWEELGIVFFSTYVGAAVHACLRRIIHPRALRRVVHAAIKDFDALHAADHDSSSHITAAAKKKNEEQAKSAIVTTASSLTTPAMSSMPIPPPSLSTPSSSSSSSTVISSPSSLVQTNSQGDIVATNQPTTSSSTSSSSRETRSSSVATDEALLEAVRKAVVPRPGHVGSDSDDSASDSDSSTESSSSSTSHLLHNKHSETKEDQSSGSYLDPSAAIPPQTTSTSTSTSSLLRSASPSPSPAATPLVAPKSTSALGSIASLFTRSSPHSAPSATPSTLGSPPSALIAAVGVSTSTQSSSTAITPSTTTTTTTTTGIGGSPKLDAKASPAKSTSSSKHHKSATFTQVLADNREAHRLALNADLKLAIKLLRFGDCIEDMIHAYYEVGSFSRNTLPMLFANLTPSILSPISLILFPFLAFSPFPFPSPFPLCLVPW